MPCNWLGVFIVPISQRKKKEPLESFLDEFELLKLEIRLCVDMKIVSFKKQAELTVLMDSIGKQISGWRNASP